MKKSYLLYRYCIVFQGCKVIVDRECRVVHGGRCPVVKSKMALKFDRSQSPYPCICIDQTRDTQDHLHIADTSIYQMRKCNRDISTRRLIIFTLAASSLAIVHLDLQHLEKDMQRPPAYSSSPKIMRAIQKFARISLTNLKRFLSIVSRSFQRHN